MTFGNVPDEFEFSLQFALGRVPNLRFRANWRALSDTDQHVIARTIRENLERANWRYRRGPAPRLYMVPDGLSESDPFDDAVDEVIATCDGDPRAAIKALLIANSYLEAELRVAQPEAQAPPGGLSRVVK